MDAVDSLALCESNQLLSPSGRDDCYQIVELMSKQAQHSLYIFSQDIDPYLFDTTHFINAVRRIVANEPNAVIRVLFHSVDKVVHRGHRLIDLSRRLGSYVQIRQLDRLYHHAFFVADQCGVLDRRVAERYAGTANFNNPGRAAELIAFFNSVWNTSAPSMELQSLRM